MSATYAAATTTTVVTDAARIELLSAEISRLNAEIFELLEKRDRMALYLENIARCPCCHELSACLEECTFATDDPNEHDRMMEARSALYGD